MLSIKVKNTKSMNEQMWWTKAQKVRSEEGLNSQVKAQKKSAQGTHDKWVQRMDYRRGRSWSMIARCTNLRNQKAPDFSLRMYLNNPNQSSLSRSYSWWGMMRSIRSCQSTEVFTSVRNCLCTYSGQNSKRTLQRSGVRRTKVPCLLIPTCSHRSATLKRRSNTKVSTLCHDLTSYLKCFTHTLSMSSCLNKKERLWTHSLLDKTTLYDLW